MRSTEKGFTLLEMLIAMGLLTLILSIFVVMIAVAAKITIDNQRDLQRAYTEVSIFEMVIAEPGAFFTDWSDGTHDWITISGLDDPAVWKQGWVAHINHDGKKVTVEVELPNER